MADDFKVTIRCESGKKRKTEVVFAATFTSGHNDERFIRKIINFETAERNEKVYSVGNIFQKT